MIGTRVQGIQRWMVTRIGPLLIGATVCCTLGLWIGTKINRHDWFPFVALYGSKACALTAATFMGWLLLLATKSRWIEQLFGGLDQAYWWHRRLGISVGVLLVLHPLFLASTRSARPWDAWSYPILPFPYPQGSYQVGANLGALLLILLVILLIAARRLTRPYRKWLHLHRWMGAVYLLSLVHIALVDRDVAHYPLLRLWLWSWLLCGVVAWLWIRLFRWCGPQTLCRVVEIHSHQDLLEIRLLPVSQPLVFEPGQWVLVEAEGIGEVGERHPLSIACAPRDDGLVELGVRVVGPWTMALQELEKGDTVRLYGPFGVLGRKFLKEPHDLICVGGGIGITPFLGIWDLALHSEELSAHDEAMPPNNMARDTIRKWKSPRVHLFYLVKDPHEAIFDRWIRQIAIASRFHGLAHAAQRGHRYDLLVSTASDPVTLEELARRCGSLEGKTILMCGPPAMMRAFRAQAKALHLADETLCFEHFEWRSGRC